MNLLSNSLRQVCSFESKSAETILLVNRLFSKRSLNQSTLPNEYVKLNESVITTPHTHYTIHAMVGNEMVPGNGTNNARLARPLSQDH